MAEPTKIQLENLERAHKEHFANLVASGLFRIGVAERYGLGSPQFIGYNYNYVKSLQKWVDREVRLIKKSGVGTLPSWIYKVRPDKFGTLFFDKAGLIELQKAAKEIDKEGTGIGFIPLIIWAVIVLISAFTAVEIVDETTNTAAEQKALLDSTAKFCADNNLSAEDCKKMVSEQTSNVTKPDEGIVGTFKSLLLWGGAAFVAVKFVVPMFTDKKQAA